MIGKIKLLIKNILPSYLGPFGKLLIILITIQLLFVHFSGDYQFRFIPRDIWRIFHSYVLILSGLLLVKSPLDPFKWISFSIQSAFVLIHCAFIGYFIKTEQSFDYAVAADNFNEIFYSESLLVILNRMDPTAYYIAFLGIGIIFYKWLKDPSFKINKFSKKKYIGVLLIYILFAVTPVLQFDGMTNFFRSAFTYYFQEPQKEYEFNYDKDSFPFLTKGDKENESIQDKPNIFLLMVESFNAGFVNSENYDGKEYTPFFNEMTKKGVYIENFYGTSVQTVKGHFSTLFSLLPLYKGKVYRQYENNNFKGLAESLKDIGYKTYFFNGHNSTGFDNTRSMMLTHGFDTYLMGKELVDESEKESWGSWGLADDELYQRVFHYLDSLKTNDSPVFVTITPSYHHVPFSIPVEKQEIYDDPISLRSRYANSIRLVDNNFRVFFEELNKRPEFQNCLILITADHSFPVGEHGIYFNEVGYYDESFRIPCLILWEGQIQPKWDKRNVFSQVDIAPTILGSIDAMPSNHHFQGQNMLKQDVDISPVFMIQPYNGTILGVIDFPFKYMKRIRTGEEWVFNLSEDPKEERNIINQMMNDQQLVSLKKSIEYIFLNQYLIENNLVYFE